MLPRLVRKSALPRVFSAPFTRWNTSTRSPTHIFSPACPYSSTRFYSSTMHDNDPKVLEEEKHRSLSRDPHDKTHSPHDHAPGWNELLASASEAAVKADKSDVKVNDLQSVTVEKLATERVELDGEASTTAHYVRDSVSGPLSGAQGKEDDMTPSEEDAKAK